MSEDLACLHKYKICEDHGQIICDNDTVSGYYYSDYENNDVYLHLKIIMMKLY